MFFAINMLNNWAFAFKISVPAHIILRSFGSVMTMGAGWLRGKRYTRLQVGSVVLLTVGVMVSAFADAKMKVFIHLYSLMPSVHTTYGDLKVVDFVQGKSMESTSSSSSSEFVTGLSVLFIAQVLSAWMGVYVQDIYSKYRAHWLENLFYSHFLSLPLFLPLQGTLRRQYRHLQDSPPADANSNFDSLIPSQLQALIPQHFQEFTTAATVPQSIVLLLINAYTQLLCISGVYLLSARSSAVTVTVVLNVRKLVSFMFSVWLFGNELSGLMVVGAVLVFGSGALYGWETNVGMQRRKGKAERVEGGSSRRSGNGKRIS